MIHELDSLRRFYKKLLRLYPRGFREQLGESMEQTFNDLYRERREAGNGLFSFVFWAFADTVAGIIKENMEKENIIMISILKQHGAVVIYLITAIAIPTAAYLLKGTEYENVWLYILAVGIVLAGAVEMYSKIKDKDKR